MNWIHPLLKSLIAQLLRCRIIKTTLGTQIILRIAARGIHQAAVLSLLWNMAINPLLPKLTEEACRASGLNEAIATHNGEVGH